MKRRETKQSPFKDPDSESVIQLSEDEGGGLKEETKEFLALPTDEKTTHTAKTTVKLEPEGELEEETRKERTKNPKHVKSKGTPPKQKTGRHELKMAMLKRENFTKESKHDFIFIERQKALLELSLMTKKAEILKMDKAIEKEEKQLKQLAVLIERENLKSEEFLRENEKKSVEARTFFERESKSKQEKTAEIKKLNAEIGSIKSEIAKSEEILVDYMRYKDLLFKLSPPEWQEAQRTRAMRAEVRSDKAAQDEHNVEPEESASTNGLDRMVSEPGRETHPLVSSQYEQDDLELYFSDPQQLLDLMAELKEQTLSLCQNSTPGEEKARELRQSIETTRKKFEKDEEQLALQISDTKMKIDSEKAKYNKNKQIVQLLLSLKTTEQDETFDALSKKIAEVHRSCVGDMATNLSTLEKLASLEQHLTLLLTSLESIPKGTLEMLRKIKDSEKRNREREEKLREQQEKQKERMRRYLERSLADSKKTSGKKLMPRCMPVAQKVKVIKKENVPAEDEIFAQLFNFDDIKE